MKSLLDDSTETSTEGILGPLKLKGILSSNQLKLLEDILDERKTSGKPSSNNIKSLPSDSESKILDKKNQHNQRSLDQTQVVYGNMSELFNFYCCLENILREKIFSQNNLESVLIFKSKQKSRQQMQLKSINIRLLSLENSRPKNFGIQNQFDGLDIEYEPVWDYYSKEGFLKKIHNVKNFTTYLSQLKCCIFRCFLNIDLIPIDFAESESKSKSQSQTKSKSKSNSVEIQTEEIINVILDQLLFSWFKISAEDEYVFQSYIRYNYFDRTHYKYSTNSFMSNIHFFTRVNSSEYLASRHLFHASDSDFIKPEEYDQYDQYDQCDLIEEETCCSRKFSGQDIYSDQSTNQSTNEIIDKTIYPVIEILPINWPTLLFIKPSQNHVSENAQSISYLFVRDQSVLDSKKMDNWNNDIERVLFKLTKNKWSLKYLPSSICYKIHACVVQTIQRQYFTIVYTYSESGLISSSVAYDWITNEPIGIKTDELLRLELVVFRKENTDKKLVPKSEPKSVPKLVPKSVSKLVPSKSVAKSVTVPVPVPDNFLDEMIISSFGNMDIDSRLFYDAFDNFWDWTIKKVLHTTEVMFNTARTKKEQEKARQLAQEEARQLAQEEARQLSQEEARRLAQEPQPQPYLGTGTAEQLTESGERQSEEEEQSEEDRQSEEEEEAEEGPSERLRREEGEQLRRETEEEEQMLKQIDEQRKRQEEEEQRILKEWHKKLEEEEEKRRQQKGIKELQETLERKKPLLQQVMQSMFGRQPDEGNKQKEGSEEEDEEGEDNEDETDETGG